jgi:hypothetical protein
MTRIVSLSAALFALQTLASCYADHRVGDNSPAVTDSVVLETEGMTFPLCTPNGASFGSGATCGSAAPGSGPMFNTLSCPNSMPPTYNLGVFFRNFSPSGIVADTTFDLSDPGHEDYITVMLIVNRGPGQEYEYCTAPPLDADGGTTTTVSPSGTVIVHQFVPAAGAPMGDYASDVEVVDAIVPPINGGPQYRVVSAHLYF